MTTLKQNTKLDDELGSHLYQAQAIQNAADVEKRDLTIEEENQIKQHLADYDSKKKSWENECRKDAISKQIEEHEKFMNASSGRKTLSDNVPRDTYKPTTFSEEMYNTHFRSYLSIGVAAGLAIGTANTGGYIAPTTTSSELIESVNELTVMRQISRVLPPFRNAGATLGKPYISTRLGTPTWRSEVPTITENDTIRFGRRDLTPHILADLVLVSKQQLMQSIVPPEQIVRDEFANSFADYMEYGFLNGSGSGEPLGVFVASDDGIPSSQDLSMGGTSDFTGDDVINLFHKLNPKYRNRPSCRFLFHDTVALKVRTFKDKNDNYIWTSGLSANPDTILGKPYSISAWAPEWNGGSNYAMVFGCFEWYWIVDVAQFEIQVLDQPYATKMQVGYLGYILSDGAPVKSDAFVRLTY